MVLAVSSLAAIYSLFVEFFVVQFIVGDVVHNKITQEEGRIVRIADPPGYGLCYIVLVAPSGNWGEAEKEVIWKQSEVSK